MCYSLSISSRAGKRDSLYQLLRIDETSTRSDRSDTSLVSLRSCTIASKQVDAGKYSSSVQGKTVAGPFFPFDS